MIHRLCIGVLALAALAGCGPSDSRKADIKLHSKVGDTYTLKYRIKTRFNVDNTTEEPEIKEDFEENHVWSYKCTKVEGGKSTWEVKTVDVKAVGTGTLASRAVTLMASQKDQVQSFTRDTQNNFSDLAFAHAFDTIFPQRPVVADDQWRGEMNLQGFKKVMRHRFGGFEKVGEKDAFVIISESDSPTVKIIEPLKVWIEVSTGWPLKGEGKFEVTDGLNYSNVSEVELTRVQ